MRSVRGTSLLGIRHIDISAPNDEKGRSFQDVHPRSDDLVFHQNGHERLVECSQCLRMPPLPVASLTDASCGSQTLAFDIILSVYASPKKENGSELQDLKVLDRQF